jgi:hypothetical protein
MPHRERLCKGPVQLRLSIIVVAGLEPGDFNLGGVMLGGGIGPATAVGALRGAFFGVTLFCFVTRQTIIQASVTDPGG